MGKHVPAEAKLHVSPQVQKKQPQKVTPPKDYTAPQAPKVGSTAKNQYR